MNLIRVIRDRLNLIGAYQRVFDTPDGKVVLAHLMREGFVVKSTFVAGDSHQTAMNEGSRRLVLSILRIVNKDQKQLLEQLEKEIQDDHIA